MDWYLWKKHLTAALALGQKDTLQKPLGNWAHYQGQIDGYFLEKEGNHLLQCKQEKWFIHTKIPSHHHQLNFHKAMCHVAEQEVPHNRWKAQIRTTKQSITIMGAALINTEPTPQNQDKDQLDMQWGIQHKIHGDMKKLEEAIRQGTAIAISDGSFQNQQGMAAWMIEGHDSSNQILGKGRTPGMVTDQSAYHSKLFELWGIFKALQMIS